MLFCVVFRDSARRRRSRLVAAAEIEIRREACNFAIRCRIHLVSCHKCCQS